MQWYNFYYRQLLRSGVTIKSDKVLNFNERYFILSKKFDRFISKDTNVCIKAFLRF